MLLSLSAMHGGGVWDVEAGYGEREVGAGAVPTVLPSLLPSTHLLCLQDTILAPSLTVTNQRNLFAWTR